MDCDSRKRWMCRWCDLWLAALIVLLGSEFGSCAEFPDRNDSRDRTYWIEKALAACQSPEIERERRGYIASEISMLFAENGRYQRAIEIGKIGFSVEFLDYYLLKTTGRAAVRNGDMRAALCVLGKIDDERAADLAAESLAMDSARMHRPHTAEVFLRRIKEPSIAYGAQLEVARLLGRAGLFHASLRLHAGAVDTWGGILSDRIIESTIKNNMATIQLCKQVHAVAEPPPVRETMVESIRQLLAIMAVVPGSSFIIGDNLQETKKRASSIEDSAERAGALRTLAGYLLKHKIDQEARTVLRASQAALLDVNMQESSGAYQNLLLIADLWIDAGRPDEAKKIIAGILATQSNDSTMVAHEFLSGVDRSLAMSLLIRLGNFDDAEKVAEKFKGDPGRRHTDITCVCAVYVEETHFERAVAYMEKLESMADKASACTGIAIGLQHDILMPCNP